MELKEILLTDGFEDAIENGDVKVIPRGKGNWNKMGVEDLKNIKANELKNFRVHVFNREMLFRMSMGDKPCAVYKTGILTTTPFRNKKSKSVFGEHSNAYDILKTSYLGEVARVNVGLKRTFNRNKNIYESLRN